MYQTGVPIPHWIRCGLRQITLLWPLENISTMWRLKCLWYCECFYVRLYRRRRQCLWFCLSVITLVSPEQLKLDTSNFVRLWRARSFTKHMQIRSMLMLSGAGSRDPLLDFGTRIIFFLIQADDIIWRHRYHRRWAWLTPETTPSCLHVQCSSAGRCRPVSSKATLCSSHVRSSATPNLGFAGRKIADRLKRPSTHVSRSNFYLLHLVFEGIGKVHLIKRLFLREPCHRSAQVWHALSRNYSEAGIKNRIRTDLNYAQMIIEEKSWKNSV